VLGKLELDITDELPKEELRRAGTAPYFRYLAELGIEDEIPLHSELSLLSRLYAARCTNPDLLAGYLSDPLWAVRFAAAGRAVGGDLVSLLEDSVAYVRLTAALRLADEGSPDAHELLREMTAIPGPVGHLATAGLTESDEDLLRELLVSPEKGKRLAALDAWNESSLTFSRSMVETLAEDEYWLVPLFLAWFLEDADEHDLTLLVYETVREDSAHYDNYRELVSELEVILGIIEGYESAPSELPFSPESVHMPDTIVLVTDCCELRVLLWKDIAPVTCANFVYLAESGFYDGIRFHRVIPGFVAQAGCPDGNGMGGPGYTIPNERNLEPYRRGVLGMADAGLNTAGSQFFIMLDDHNRLDGRYTAFGELVDYEGLDDITVGTLIEHIRL
jgi:cyclophilin family peptidyl-prolyl cis-trans isomerase